MQYRKDKYGRDISALGFGCMRFTKKGAGIDLVKANREIMTAYKAGVNYYDTAYLYPGSEVALGKILEKNKKSVLSIHILFAPVCFCCFYLNIQSDICL